MGELWIWLQKFSNLEESILLLGSSQVTGLVGSSGYPVFLLGTVNPLICHTLVYSHLNWRPSLQGRWGIAFQEHRRCAVLKTSLIVWPWYHHLGVSGSLNYSTSILQKEIYVAHQYDLYRTAASCLHHRLLTNGLQKWKKKIQTCLLAQSFRYSYDKVGHKIPVMQIKGRLRSNLKHGTALLP